MEGVEKSNIVLKDTSHPAIDGTILFSQEGNEKDCENSGLFKIRRGEFKILYKLLSESSLTSLDSYKGNRKAQ